MKNKNELKFLKIAGKVAKIILYFTLAIFAKILSDSAKEKEHEPTTQELMCGKKIIGSDKYFIPDQKLNRK